MVSDYFPFTRDPRRHHFSPEILLAPPCWPSPPPPLRLRHPAARGIKLKRFSHVLVKWLDLTGPGSCLLCCLLINRVSISPFRSSHTDFPLSVSQTQSAGSCVRAFALALPSAWNTFARASLFKHSFLSEAFFDHPLK